MEFVGCCILSILSLRDVMGPSRHVAGAAAASGRVSGCCGRTSGSNRNQTNDQRSPCSETAEICLSVAPARFLVCRGCRSLHVDVRKPFELILWSRRWVNCVCLACFSVFLFSGEGEPVLPRVTSGSFFTSYYIGCLPVEHVQKTTCVRVGKSGKMKHEG